MKNQKILFVVSLLFLMSSCADEYLTEGEMLGKKIQQFTESENISKATAYLLKVDTDEAYYIEDIKEVSFSIDGQIIEIGSKYYNLNKLVKYQPESGGNSEKILGLYFDGYQ